MVMTAADVIEVLELLEDAGIEAWVDGGWGVDALLGEQTREHDDLDLTIPAGSVPAARALFEVAGFATLRDWLPVALALRDPGGREVDLHPLAPAPDGGGDQAQPQSPPFHYGPPAGGRIAGRPVRCVAAETQLRAHLGYPPTAKDERDVRLLAERFRLEPPPPYA